MTASLFGEEPTAPAIEEIAPDAPLAERMRPRTPEEYLGQRHLVGSGKILARALAGDLKQSLILWGPPGCGKTTLARLIASACELRFVPFSAVLSGIKEIKAVMAEASDVRRRTKRRTLMFIDEIHRFNKAQQDAFLPYVERGDILLIGATTENPSFEVVGPLLSRARTVMLQPLGPDELLGLLRNAVEGERGLAGALRASDEALQRVANASDGDARRALTLLETAADLVESGGELTDEVLAEALQRKVLRHDKSGDAHYDLISALHKSVRNSAADAALYWITRLLEGGEDRRYVARRLIRMAVEDIGLGDPNALSVTVAAAAAYDRLGTPEGDLALVQAAVYMAHAEKSNSVYAGYNKARQVIQERPADPVPMHLRNAATGLMKNLGFGAGYRYAPDDPDAVEEMQCLPDELAGEPFLE